MILVAGEAGEGGGGAKMQVLVERMGQKQRWRRTQIQGLPTRIALIPAKPSVPVSGLQRKGGFSGIRCWSDGINIK